MHDSTEPPCDTSGADRTALLEQYSHMEQQIGLAANKASLLVAALSILAATYVAFAKDCAFFEPVPIDVTRPAWWFAAAGGVMFVGLICSLCSVLPKIVSNKGEHGDVLFYANIAVRWNSSAEYWAAWKERVEDRRLDSDIAANIWGKARWLRRQFKWVTAAIAAAIVATVMSTIAVVWSESRNELQCNVQTALRSPAVNAARA